MEKLILIDGNSLINRAFYATPPMNTVDGTPTNAVYSFVNMLIRLTLDHNPTHMAVAFDLKEPTFRHKMCESYKATRKPSPNELGLQFFVLKKVLEAMDIAYFEKVGFEADDIIGTISKKCELPTIIVTGDRDAFQLVDPKISVMFTKRGITDTEIYNFENFFSKIGLMPEKTIDLKAIMGDASDNIAGVLGIGEKGAKNLLGMYESLDGVYNNIENISGALQQKLVSGKNSAYLSYKLATIDTNVPVIFTNNQLKYNFPLPEKARQLFSELEFKTLAKKDIYVVSQKQKQNSIDTVNITQDTQIKLGKVFSFYEHDKIFLYSQNTPYEIKIKNNFFDEGLDAETAYLKLKSYFENPLNTAVLFNTKSCRHTLSNLGINLNCNTEDISIKKYLANFTGRDETLKDIAAEYEIDILNPAKAVHDINLILDEQLKEQDLTNLYKQIELPLSNVLFDMEKSGFKIDTIALNELKQKYEEELSSLSAKIHLLTGEDFNINSPKQLAEVLFNKLGLNKGKKTKTGYSTNVDVLESLKDSHPVIEKILLFRKKQKLLSTYIEGFLPLINQSTGLVHTSFNQLVTTTGRLSSKEPNLQNIPVRDDDGREIRRLFVAREKDRVLVGADYSQIELRLLAAFSECQKLIDAFNNGEDIHKLTASEVFGVPVSQVDAKMRYDAKAVNFGIIYGISDFGLSQNLNISRKQAAQYIEKYFLTYPEVKTYMNKNVEFAKKHGYVTTCFGRRRQIREIFSPNYTVRSFGERAAMNMPLQGSSADIIKIAMINVHNRLKDLKSELVLQVHDELIVDAFVDEEQEIKNILKEEMENALLLKVPLTVEVSSGENWDELK